MKKYPAFKLILIALLLVTVVGSAFQMVPKDGILDRILKQLSLYQETYSPEKVYLHLDKPYYFSGDDLWFKAYVMNAMTHLTDSASGVLYVELLNDKGAILISEKIKLSQGSGHGDLSLNEDLPTAMYQIRAYTRWMQNGKADFFFHQQISIIHTNDKLLLSKPADEGIDIQFFPEGGDLVEGLESTIAFKATDKRGKGIDTQISILADNKDTVGKFAPIHGGMGSLRFIPIPGKTYQAIVKNGSGKIAYFPLPKPQTQGWVMHTENSANTISLTLKSTHVEEEKIFIVAQTRGKAIYQGEGRILNQQFSLQIPATQFPTGVTQLTVFDANGIPQCERLIFINQNDQVQLELTTNKKTYLPREKVTLTLMARNAQGTPVAGDFSLSIEDTRSFSSPEQNILTNLLLTSDLKGTIENPAFYFQRTNPIATAALDNLMLTQGWRRFVWKEILQLASSEPAYEHEPDIALSVKLIDKNTGKFIPAQILLISAPGTSSVFRYGYTNAEGEINLSSLDFYDYRNVIVSIYNKDLHSSAIVVADSVKSASEFIGFTPSVFVTSSIQKTAERQKIWSMIQSKDKTSESITTATVVSNDTLRPVQPIYQKADDIIKLDEYTLFPTMEEVIRDIVPWGLLTHKKGQTGFRLLNPATKLYIKYNPLYLIDNVPVHNIDPVLALDPASVYSIESVRSAVGRGQFGEIGFNGIFSVFTKAGDFYPSNEPGLFNFSVRGFQKAREYYSPNYETTPQNYRKPDFRNMLYWNPSVKTDATGKATITFYNSDDLTTWRVVAQGMSANGKPATSHLEYNVRMDIK